MKNILITGGAGYLGSVLTPFLLLKGYNVTVLDNFLFRQMTLADCYHQKAFRIVRGDCRDERLMSEELKRADIVIPLAALVGAPLCAREPHAATSTNEEAVRMLARLLSPSQRILFPTTNSGYGIGEGSKMCTEESPLRPISLYGENKARAEAAVLAHGNSLTFRLATVFGMSSRMRLDLLVNDFVYRAVYDRSVVIFEPHFKRNYIHIRDVARAFLHGIENFDAMKGRPYNVGLDSANLSKWELALKIKEQLPAFTILEAPIGEDPDKRDYIVSNARIASTGFQPKFSLEDGIAELIKGYSCWRYSGLGNV